MHSVSFFNCMRFEQHVLRPSTLLTDTGLLHRDMAPQVCTGRAKRGRIFSLDDSEVSCVSE